MITATSQQTRFDPSVTNASEIDLCDVDITVGEREILTSARVRLKSGTRYGLIGSNGCGKSSMCLSSITLTPALFEALCDKLIPGIPAGLRIYLVRQVEDEPSGGSDATTLEHVLKGHVEREDALQDKDSEWNLCLLTQRSPQYFPALSRLLPKKHRAWSMRSW